MSLPTPKPWSIWLADGEVIGPVAVHLGHLPNGQGNFIGLHAGHAGFYYLAFEQTPFKGNAGSLRLIDHLGMLPSGLPRWAHVTLCNNCGTDAFRVRVSKTAWRWYCNRRCPVTDPRRLENSQLVEWFLEFSQLLVKD